MLSFENYKLNGKEPRDILQRAAVSEVLKRDIMGALRVLHDKSPSRLFPALAGARFLNFSDILMMSGTVYCNEHCSRYESLTTEGL